MTVPAPPRRRYMPLVYRVAGVNAVLLVAAVAVAVIVLRPGQFSSVAADEAVVIVAALILLVVANVLLLRRVVRPIEALTALARRVDLAEPGERLPGAEATSEAGELALSFNEMLARLEAERREATGRVLEAQEAERLRIAQELHDQVGQELTAVLLGLARVHKLVGEPLRDDVGHVQDAVRASLEDVRRIAIELRPEALDDLGLVSALAVLCERFSQRSGLTVAQHIAGDLPRLDEQTELVIYRVAQEALTNVARHSGAARAELSLRRDGAGSVVMTVGDEGRGLVAGAQPGTGIRGMRERAALVGGRLRVSLGAGGRGCEVSLTVSANGHPEAR
jgi:two-component system, NarL family, sensor histidine kinase UhpB